MRDAKKALEDALKTALASKDLQTDLLKAK